MKKKHQIWYSSQPKKKTPKVRLQTQLCVTSCRYPTRYTQKCVCVCGGKVFRRRRASFRLHRDTFQRRHQRRCGSARVLLRRRGFQFPIKSNSARNRFGKYMCMPRRKRIQALRFANRHNAHLELVNNKRVRARGGPQMCSKSKHKFDKNCAHPQIWASELRSFSSWVTALKTSPRNGLYSALIKSEYDTARDSLSPQFSFFRQSGARAFPI